MNINNKNHILFSSKTVILIVFCIGLLNSCATSNHKTTAKKNSIFQRAYNDITLHYNYYFNAKDILKQKSKEVAKSSKPDYTKILNPLPISPTDAQAMVSDLDNVFKKSSIGIQLHPTSKWVDDAYLLMGISNYYKGEYKRATETFQFINAEFKNGNKLHKYKAKKIKSRIKKDEDKIDMPDYTKAKDNNTSVDEKKPIKKSSKKKAYKKKKKHYSKKKKKPAAKKTSTTTNKVSTDTPKEKETKKELGVSINMDPKTKKVVKYVQSDSVAIAAEMAQEKKGFLGRLRHKPVAYNAQLWMLKTFIQENKYPEAETVISNINSEPKFPKKLLGEYNATLAQYYIQKQDFEKAKFTLKKSIEYTKNKNLKARYNFILGQLSSLGDENQKSKAYFKKCIKNKPDYEMQFNAMMNLIDLNHKDGTKNGEQTIAELKKMTREAKNTDYLDKIYSTMADIAIEEGDIDKAITYLTEATKSATSNATIKANAYEKIARIFYEKEQYVKSYAYYDSTVTLAPKDAKYYDEASGRYTILAKLVPPLETIAREDSLQKLATLPTAALNEKLDDIIEKAIEAKEAADYDNSKLENSSENTTASNGTWYFYNTESKAAGYNDFIKKWGSRANSDNWRRSQKSAIIEEESNDSVAVAINKKINSGEVSRADLLKLLPTTPERKLISDNKIIEALYTAGGIFLMDIKNNTKAISSLEKLVADYPKNKYEEPALYQLYLLYNKTNVSKAQQYASSLRAKYPSGTYANLLDNKGGTTTKKDNSQVAAFYEETFKLYLDEKYQEAINNKIVAEEMFDENPLQPKFDFIAALCLGKVSDRDTMKQALEMILKKYPKDEVRPKVEEILTMMKKDPKASAPVENKDPLYNFNAKEKHWVMIIINSDAKTSSDAENRITDLNSKNYSVKKLKSNKISLTPARNILLVKEFEDAAAAQKYAKEISANKKLFEGLNKAEPWIVPIGASNFNTFLKSKNEELYKNFATLNFK